MSVIRHNYLLFFHTVHKAHKVTILILRPPLIEVDDVTMKNEINDPTNLAERLSKFDRELNPGESIKDNAILRHITRQTQLKLDLTQLDNQAES